jgi:hypothetical protein
MNVCLMQPTFMPWMGYFELISKVDKFVILDDFQFSVQSYHQRNRMFVNRNQVGWYTVPIRRSASFQMPLNQTQINDDIPWRMKFWKRLEQNYRKSDYFSRYHKPLLEWLMVPGKNLAQQNIGFITMVCKDLGLNPEFRYSSEHTSILSRSKRVLELLQWCDADRYFCAQGSFGYMADEKVFPVDGVEVHFQDFTAREYPQSGKPVGFESHLSVMDALMNVGPDRTVDLITSGTERWLTWEMMRSKHYTKKEPEVDAGGEAGKPGSVNDDR